MQELRCSVAGENILRVACTVHSIERSLTELEDDDNIHTITGQLATQTNRAAGPIPYLASQLGCTEGEEVDVRL